MTHLGPAEPHTPRLIRLSPVLGQLRAWASTRSTASQELSANYPAIRLCCLGPSVHPFCKRAISFLPSLYISSTSSPRPILTLKLLPTSQKKISPSSYHHRALTAEAALQGSPCSGSRQTAVRVTMGSQFLGEEGRLDGDRAVGMALLISVGSSVIREPATQQGVGIQCRFVIALFYIINSICAVLK